MKYKKYFILGFALLAICFQSSFLFYAQAAPPPEYRKVKPTSGEIIDYGFHKSGEVEDVWDYDGDYMRFQQSGPFLVIEFEFPDVKCAVLYFYFTDTCTWPYEYAITINAYYVNHPLQVLSWGIKNGNHEFALYSLEKLDSVRVFMWWCWGQYINIDLMVAKTTL